ncbi:unnamed protein product [Notodromas monacha]|uniref:Uncharacterized protein n=1 Tax=Notodromas monacha TaxID=399045 RepID=A0A7R9G9L3_9CRUS|nr:unnamed protein product [Notodromas monacha]CAG0914332.1 unnamed protein product [Notodromas monacha]
MGNHHSGRHRVEDDDDHFYYTSGRLPSPFNKQQQQQQVNGSYQNGNSCGGVPGTGTGVDQSRLIKPPSGLVRGQQTPSHNGANGKPSSSNSSRSTSPTNHSFIPTPRSLQNTPNVPLKHQNGSNTASGIPARNCMIPGRSSLRLPSTSSGSGGKSVKQASVVEDDPKTLKTKGSSMFDKLNVFHRDKERASTKALSSSSATRNAGSGTNKRASSSSGFSSAHSQSDSSSVDRPSPVLASTPSMISRKGAKTNASPKLRKRSEEPAPATSSISRLDASRRSSRGSRMPVPVSVPMLPQQTSEASSDLAFKPTAAVKATPLSDHNILPITRAVPEKEAKLPNGTTDEKHGINIALVSPMLNRRMNDQPENISIIEKVPEKLAEPPPPPIPMDPPPPLPTVPVAKPVNESCSESEVKDEVDPDDEIVMNIRPMEPVLRTANFTFLRGLSRGSASAASANSPFEAFLRKRMNNGVCSADPGQGYLSDSEATGYNGAPVDNFDGYMSEGGAGLHAASKRKQPMQYPVPVPEDARLPSNLSNCRPSTNGQMGKNRPGSKRDNVDGALLVDLIFSCLLLWSNCCANLNAQRRGR